MKGPRWSALLCVVAIACGGDDDGKPGPMDTGGDSGQSTQPFRLSAPLVVASACIYKLTAETGGKMLSDCTGFETLLSCAREHCNLDACVAQCAEYVTCLDQTADPCDQTCVANPACADCINEGYTCNFRGPCAGM